MASISQNNVNQYSPEYSSCETDKQLSDEVKMNAAIICKNQRSLCHIIPGFYKRVTADCSITKYPAALASTWSKREILLQILYNFI